jgi:hypothetical protein
MSLFVEIYGWLGAGLILIAYGLVSSGKAPARGWLYQGLNIAGSSGILTNAAWNSAWPSVGLNAAWILIGLVTLWSVRHAGPPTRQDM